MQENPFEPDWDKLFDLIKSTEELKCPHGRPVYLGPCYLCEMEALNHAS